MKNTSGKNQLNEKMAGAPSEADWLTELDSLLRSRQVGKGSALLDHTESLWAGLDLPQRSSSDFLLSLAQWVDVGYRDALFLRRMLDLVPDVSRLRLSVVDYVRLRLAEAFYIFAVDRTSEAITTLETILRLDQELLDPEMKLLAHLWKARAHRKDADYQKASKHILAALELAASLPDAKVIFAVLQVQHGWILFQCADVPGAVKVFDEAEAVLRHTDHWIALGNIASARGRMVRRKGDYARALEHFLCAVKFYEARHPQHQNLARAVTNLAFVKRLLALEIKRHIDSSVARREVAPTGGTPNKSSLRALHHQYQQLYRSAIAELERAESICALNRHPSGLASALLNAGYLHLDVGELDLAEQQAERAFEIGESTQAVVLMARGKILLGLIDNARVEELLGHPAEAPLLAQRAKRQCLEAVSLAETTQNKRLIINAHLALGDVAANGFFKDYDLARRCVDLASRMIDPQEADYVVDELNLLKGKLLRMAGIDDALRAWSQGIIADKSLQQITEEFAELVVTKIWLREGRRTAHVAALLATSPKKVRRLVRHAAK
jgi:tetratricopeptide (TPR) repeat protein